MADEEDRQNATWGNLYVRLVSLMQQFGTEGARRSTDCWVDDDDIGTRQQKIYIRNLELLRPSIVRELQALVSEFPDWEIVVAVSVPDHGDAWPAMGLTVRPHEIIDGLQRQYFPPEFRNVEYEFARPGTERD